MSVIKLLQSLHGHVGVLAAAALLHPAFLLRKGHPLSRGARWAVALSTGFTTLAFVLGISIYGDYRGQVRRQLFAQAPQTGLLFETKEHLAFAVVCYALAGGICALAAPPRAADLRKTAAVLFLGAALGCLVVVGLGTVVAATRSF